MRDPKFNSAFATMMYAFWKKREQEGYPSAAAAAGQALFLSAALRTDEPTAGDGYGRYLSGIQTGHAHSVGEP